MERNLSSFTQLIEAIFNKYDDLNSNEKKYLNFFKSYIRKSGWSSKNTTDFGQIEFLNFIRFTSKERSINATYFIATAVRRHITKQSALNFSFKSNPSKWPVPSKPKPDHFDPLSIEQHDTLTEFLHVEIDKIYAREAASEKALLNGKSITKTGKDFKHRKNPKTGISFYTWQESLEDFIYTLVNDYPSFPNAATKEDLSNEGRFGQPKKVDYAAMDSPFKTIYKRMALQRLNSSIPFLKDATELNFIDAVNYLFPNQQEAYVIRWAIALESGWSPDIVKRINPNDYLFQAIPVEEKLAFIKSFKFKGEQVGNSYSEAKMMIHPSLINDKYSAYSLIKLWLKRTQRFRHGIWYKHILDDIYYDPFFVVLSNNYALGEIFIPEHPGSSKIRNRGSKRLSLWNELGFKFDERQLRPTCLYLREKNQNMPLLLQVALFGHSNSAITDEFYKGSAAFQQDRKDKLALELNEIEKSIHNDSFKGTLAPLREKKSIKDKIITIFTDHSNESPLAICSNPFSPDWKGHKKKIRQGNPCRAFNKCLLCSCSIVMSDNIPFVVDRYIFLEQKKRNLRIDQFYRLYQEEYTAAKEVVETWPYKEEVDEATDRTLIEGYLLPPILAEAF